METWKHIGKIILNLTISLVVLILIIWVLPKAILFFMPFLIGALIAACAGPLVQFLESKFKVKRKAGSAVTIILAVGMVALILYGIGRILTQQVSGFLENLPQMWEALKMDLEQAGRKIQILFSYMPKQLQTEWSVVLESSKEYIGNNLGNLSSPTMEWVGRVAKNVPGFLVKVIMSLLSAYFFVANKDEVQEYYRKYIPNPMKEKWEIVCRSLKKAFGGYLIAQLKIEIWMYLLLVVGLKIAGVNYVTVIAFGIAILDLLPVFGTGTVLIPWALIKMLGGHYTTAVIFASLWGIGQLLRQLIQPKIVGESLGMPAIPTLFLLYIGWETAGVAGMIFAVPIGLVFVNLYKEGVFRTTKDSIEILIRDVNAFRKYSSKDYTFHEKIQDKEE